jgi:hypothetical protein
LPHGLPSTLFGIRKRHTKNAVSPRLMNWSLVQIVDQLLRTDFRVFGPAIAPGTPGRISGFRSNLEEDCSQRDCSSPRYEAVSQIPISQKINRLAANDAREVKCKAHSSI